MTSVRITDCEFNAYNYPMQWYQNDITDVVDAGQLLYYLLRDVKSDLHGTNTFAVVISNTSTVAVNDKGMITVTGHFTCLVHYPGLMLLVLICDWLTLATNGSNDLSI